MEFKKKKTLLPVLILCYLHTYHAFIRKARVKTYLIFDQLNLAYLLLREQFNVVAVNTLCLIVICNVTNIQQKTDQISWVKKKKTWLFETDTLRVYWWVLIKEFYFSAVLKVK